MDPLCHTLVGACLGETGLARRLRGGRLTAIVAANLPDLDVLSQLGGSDCALLHRRGWTHGVLAMGLLPALLAALVLFVDRRRCRRDPGRSPVPAGPLTLLSYLALLTHPLLDWLNTYGVRLLMPFDRRWFHGDGVFIVDPWLWLLPAAGTVLARRAAGKMGRREGASWLVLGALGLFVVIGSGQAPAPAALAWTAAFALVLAAAASVRPTWRPAWLARAGLVSCFLYAGGLFACQHAAERTLDRALLDAGRGPLEAPMIGPRPMNPLSWQVVGGREGSWQLARAELGPRSRVAFGARRERLSDSLETSEVLRAAWAAEGLEGFRGWARFPFAEVESRAGGWTVWFLDARYVASRQEGFGAAVVELDESLRVLSVR